MIAAFFVGITLRAWTAGQQESQGQWTRSPCAALEVIIGTWALALMAGIPYFNLYMPWVIGEEPGVWRYFTKVFIGSRDALIAASRKFVLD